MASKKSRRERAAGAEPVRPAVAVEGAVGEGQPGGVAAGQEGAATQGFSPGCILALILPIVLTLAWGVYDMIVGK